MIYDLFKAIMNDINNTMNDIVIDVVNDKNSGKMGRHFPV